MHKIKFKNNMKYIFKIKDKNKIITLLVLVICLGLFTCFTSNANVCTANNVNIRSGASLDAKIIGKLSIDEDVQIVDVEGDWVKISRDGIIGYVHNDYIKEEDNATVNDNSVNFRALPNVTSNIINKFYLGNRVNALETVNDFYKVFSKGKVGFVHKDLVKLDNPEEFIQNEQNKKVADNATINDMRINVRTKPNTYNSVIRMQLNTNDRVAVVSDEGSWYKIYKDYEYLYISKAYLDLDEGALIDTTIKAVEGISETKQNDESLNENETIPNEQVIENEEVPEALYKDVYVKAITGLNLRTEPSVLSTKVRKTPMEYKLKIKLIKEEGKWAKVRTPNGEEGYASLEFLTYDPDELFRVPNEELRNKIIDYAKQFRGAPYRYSGTSFTTGIDCSGYMQKVFAEYGVEIERTSVAQSREGTRVTKQELMPGDLVFFSTNGTGGVSHVGLYVGDNKYWHASCSVGITESNFSDPGNGTFLWGARIIQ